MHRDAFEFRGMAAVLVLGLVVLAAAEVILRCVPLGLLVLLVWLALELVSYVRHRRRVERRSR